MAEKEERVRGILEAKFRRLGSTVLEVAHRLWAVAGCDRVVVMENGEIAEIGPPATLLDPQNGQSKFRNMVASLGDEDLQAVRAAVRREEVDSHDC
uniref:ABC transporter domain-containing protein n=1 Tax=Oxyrrhis marina TaxID=2969 RepID=A0A7S4GN22_OXYMA